MDLGIDSVREAARAIAEDRMTDVCEVRRGETTGVRDPDTGKVTYVEPELVYGPGLKPHEGKCRIRMPYANAAALVDGGAVTVMQQTHLGVPADVVLRTGDKVKVLASDNPLLVGQEFTIRPLPTGSQQSANRYGIEAVR